ncbi:hypothetical protein HYH03_009960 [Edaphochlamys debaryana]|uniref:Uncharacterized protein n=1 Tax=Edaphochlamys debaryana TaxID=47281 RepID=A0A836BWS0_9CHLO|nr:hypothetical protein HYH03_009960 [Edaphochlamys debaryana]|eukprot:KAG2491800.1 hypothetical protein HYH03_009960 [Edaphochlamys debaryana]
MLLAWTGQGVGPRPALGGDRWRRRASSATPATPQFRGHLGPCEPTRATSTSSQSSCNPTLAAADLSGPGAARARVVAAAGRGDRDLASSRRDGPTDRSDAARPAGGAGRNLNLRLQDARSCAELLSLLPSPDRDRAGLSGPAPPFSPVNIATAWVKLATLQSGRRGGGRGGGGGGRAREDEAASARAEQDAAEAATQLLLGATAAKGKAAQETEGTGAAGAGGMELRGVANTLWAIAKLDDEGLPRSAGGAAALQRLQKQALELLRPLAAPPTEAAGVGGAASGKLPPPDLRDVAQLWYGVGSIRFGWSADLMTSLTEATLAALEAVTAPLAASAAAGGGASRRAAAPSADALTAASQVVFRMGTTVGAKMSAPHKARVAGIISAMAGVPPTASSPSDTPASSAPPPPLANPDCLLTGAYLLRIQPAQLPAAAVRRLYESALAAPPAAARRAGRVAMARALHSALQLGLQPTAAEAKAWQVLLVDKMAPPGSAPSGGADGEGGDGDGGGGGVWRSDELSWTMLALSSVPSYGPDEPARGAFIRAVCSVLRRCRANDATRIREAVEEWRLALPPRERALLGRMAGGGRDAAAGEEGGRGGGGGGGGGGRGQGAGWGVQRGGCEGRRGRDWEVGDEEEEGEGGRRFGGGSGRGSGRGGRGGGRGGGGGGGRSSGRQYDRSRW